MDQPQVFIDYEIYQREVLWKQMMEEIWWNCIPEFNQSYIEDPKGCKEYNLKVCEEIKNKEEYKCFKDETEIQSNF